MISMKFNRSHYIENINKGMISQEVILGGWVEDLRKMGKMTIQKLEILSVKLKLMRLTC